MVSPSLAPVMSKSRTSPVVAARSTVLSEPKRPRRPSSCSSTSASVTSAGSTVTSIESYAGSSNSGHDVHLGGERQRRGVLEVGDVDLGAAEQLDLVLAQRVVEVGVHRVAERLVEDGGAADALVDDAVGHLALAEAGHLDLGGDPLVGGVERWLQLLERHLDGELHPGGREGLDSALHGDRCSWIGWLRGSCVPRGRAGRSASSTGGDDGRAVRPSSEDVDRADPGAGPRPQSGRGESNSRSPAPKAGALATTLRPAAPHRV